MMNNCLIAFKNMNWESPALGVRQKVHIEGKQKIRLVEFSEEFEEKDWCMSGHVGYVLEGKMSVDFNGEMIDFKAGDGLFVPKGEAHKHKAMIAKGDKVLIVLFEVLAL